MDRKEQLIKAMGLKYIGWGLYKDNLGSNYMWNITRQEMKVMKPFSDKHNKESYITLPDGTHVYVKDGEIHRDGDKPAVLANVSKSFEHHYYKNGKHNREGDKPSSILNDGTKIWHKDGEYHRDDDKPAIEYPSGKKQYYKNGKFIKEKINETKLLARIDEYLL